MKMRRYFDLDDAVNQYYGDVNWFPDDWENVRKNGRWVTKVTWFADEEGGKDSYEYIDIDEWEQWALNRRYGTWVKVVKDGIVVYE